MQTLSLPSASGRFRIANFPDSTDTLAIGP